MNILIFSLIFQQILNAYCDETTYIPTVTDNSATTSVPEMITTIDAITFIDNVTMIDNINSTVEDETTIKSVEKPLMDNFNITYEDPSTEHSMIDATDNNKTLLINEGNTNNEKTIEVDKMIENDKLNVNEQDETIDETKVNKTDAMDDVMQNDEAAINSTNAVFETTSPSPMTTIQDVKNNSEGEISSSTTTITPLMDKTTNKIDSGLTSLIISTVSTTTQPSVIYKIPNATLPNRSTTINPQQFNGNHTKNSANSLWNSSTFVSVLLLLGNVYYIGLSF